ncbi:hypothetical protein OIU79_007476 [Salix purpurea]|uniref:Uncharacterized protein n=1 Tax=Salix purpurea TaxID=77065 RepID=A0A9Q0TY02_SALPP|nr:hypothetical protein OIU79_007476 [Salix purpurea]
MTLLSSANLLQLGKAEKGIQVQVFSPASPISLWVPCHRSKDSSLFMTDHHVRSDQIKTRVQFN